MMIKTRILKKKEGNEREKEKRVRNLSLSL
jgi:hypothetical protein